MRGVDQGLGEFLEAVGVIECDTAQLIVVRKRIDERPKVGAVPLVSAEADPRACRKGVAPDASKERLPGIARNAAAPRRLEAADGLLGSGRTGIAGEEVVN